MRPRKAASATATPAANDDDRSANDAAATVATAVIVEVVAVVVASAVDATEIAATAIEIVDHGVSPQPDPRRVTGRGEHRPPAIGRVVQPRAGGQPCAAATRQ